MAYKHGVYTSEVATSMVAPITGTAGLQVIVGTAPVNMLKDPAAAVNVPLLVTQPAAGSRSHSRWALDIGKHRIKFYGKGSITGVIVIK